ncbi:hypothetical protein DPMN_037740 [Dreissena polymorpha]|uniref:Uncharacterized protein n=1 Tax=Dreissena polymorpha TaxID=45954 RepID=A0A9D4ME49_DREPO|nr:hypothetical protein DPMN_037740 [Dreissena polymorpha]
MNIKWPHGGNVFQQTGSIFELVQDIIGTNLKKFHEDPTINLASTVLTRQIFMAHNERQTIAKSAGRTKGRTERRTERRTDNAKTISLRLWRGIITYFKKTAPPPGGHVFQPIWIIFELNRHIQKTHVLTKFHQDWNITSRVFTCFHYIHIEKSAPLPGGQVFSPIWTIFELAKIVTSRVFTRNTAPHPGSHVFQRTGTIFKLNQHIIKTNILTKLHEDWASNVTSTVFTSFELIRGFNKTNVLTKFHDDRTINVASGVFTRQMLTTHDGQKAITKANHEHSSETETIFKLIQDIIGANLLTKKNVADGRRTTDKRRSQKLTMSTLCSGELKNINTTKNTSLN